MITPTDIAEIGGLGLTFSTLIVGGLVRLTNVISKQSVFIQELKENTKDIKEDVKALKDLPDRITLVENTLKARFCPWNGHDRENDTSYAIHSGEHKRVKK